MTITYQVGNLLTQKGLIVHGCNCLGVMGAGLAVVLKTTYPEAFEAYESRFKHEGLMLGDVIAVGSVNLPADTGKWVLRTAKHIPEDVIVVNALTQFDVRSDSNPKMVHLDYDALESCMHRVAAIARATGLPINLPLIGCGLAGGQWSKALPIIERALGDLDATVWALSPLDFSHL